ncbi:hypothetical protein ASZ90_018002 [hydrocarbon metagenome]|uniref:Uncharacterized protein n=1 Tax=hydrocarbon metagenome TaxID=938273 RepID=A0A0W8E8E0_9ZZZZ
MNFGPWEIAFILLLLGILVLPLIVVLKMLSMEKRMTIIEEHMRSGNQNYDPDNF